MSKNEEFSIGMIALGTALPIILLVLVAGDADLPQSPVAKTFILAVLLFLAFILVIFKEQYQFLYGATETVVAVVGAWRMMSGFGSATEDANVVGLFGAIYIMTRGISNMYASKKPTTVLQEGN